MLTLRKMNKSDILINMFTEVGDNHPWEEVCEVTGIKNYDSLRSFLRYLRKSPRVQESSRFDIRLKDGICVRVN